MSTAFSAITKTRGSSNSVSSLSDYLDESREELEKSEELEKPEGLEKPEELEKPEGLEKPEELDKPEEQQQDGNDDGHGDMEFIVEKIIDKRIGPDGQVKYLVKWENYPASANTWEPLDNLVGCDRALESFELVHAEKTALRFKRMCPQKRPVPASKRGPASKRSAVSEKTISLKSSEWRIDDILGVTRLGEEKYFLISFVNGPGPSFIRASIANSLFPTKVIEFYIRHLIWKETAEI